MNDPYPSAIAAAAAFTVTCYLSLVLGALRSYSLARFEELLPDDKARLARLRTLLEDEDQLVLAVTALRGIATTLGLVALTATVVAAAGGGLVAWAEAVGLGVVVFVAFGHLVPHAIGERRAEPVIVRCLPSVDAMRLVATPLLWVFTALNRLALRAANVDEEDEAEEIKDEILSAALAGENEGVIDEQTKDVIKNLIEFRDVSVGEVMTPRPDIVAVDAGEDVEVVLKKALEHQFSRLPVVDRSLDRVIGIVMVKDLFRAALERRPVDLRSLSRPPMFVPETKKVADLLKELRGRKTHMAMVADEYGGTAGLVTIEDCIEEIIGEIEDEHDTDERPPIRRVSEVEADLDAKVPIDEVNEELGTKIPEEEEVETIGGFITMRLGKIPVKGDKVALNGYLFTVTDADERRVRRVHLRMNVPAVAVAPPS
ncbi:MAG: HlyC/CorC family transporter [Planctomycetota bacterium]|nr:HlyC/CorC family transporter [Planctomycetota bacterium]